MTAPRQIAIIRSLFERRHIRRGGVVCVFAGLAGMIAPAQVPGPSQQVTVTLLPSYTNTSEGSANKDLVVTDSNATGANGQPLPRVASWLYFRADGLPDLSNATLMTAQLRLVRNTGGLQRTMLIRVFSAKASDPPDKPSNYQGDREVARIQSDRIPSDRGAKTEDHSPSWDASRDLVRSHGDGRRYIGLLLVPSETSASRRFYYGLRPGDSEADLQPRLTITYRYKSVPTFGCTSNPPPPLVDRQSDGSAARISGCDFITKTPPQNKDVPGYETLTVAADSLTAEPAIYGDQLFVVRNHGGEGAYLEAKKPLGETVWSAKVPGTILPGSRMVVNRFGRLRIVAQDAIYTCQLQADQTCGKEGIKKAGYDFGSVPAGVIEGPDGTLYIVSKGIYALNPDTGPVDGSGNITKRLWSRAVDNSLDAKITLSPDGGFVYALASVLKKSQFLAINARTGKDIDLKNEVTAAVFPANLTTLYNPVVARHPDGADLIFIAGNTNTAGVLWGVTNTTKDGISAAKLEMAWHPKSFPCDTNPCIGQPALDSKADSKPNLSDKKLYFLLSNKGRNADVTTVSVLDGALGDAIDLGKAAIAVDGNPVMDAAGNEMFWANNTLYGLSAASRRSLFAHALNKLGNPRLIFGPAGTLYAAQDRQITALIPLFNLAGVTSPVTISSPTHLWVGGAENSPAVLKGEGNDLKAAGDVILGPNFAVQMGATLTVTIQK